MPGGLASARIYEPSGAEVSTLAAVAMWSFRALSITSTSPASLTLTRTVTEPSARILIEEILQLALWPFSTKAPLKARVCHGWCRWLGPFRSGLAVGAEFSFGAWLSR